MSYGSGYTARSVRDVCEQHRIAVSKKLGEWRLVLHEFVGTKRAESTAYYTDDNEDAILTAIRMRRDFIPA